MGEEPLKIGIEQHHKAFVLGYQHLKKAKKRQAKYANRNSEYTELHVGDPVYLKQQQHKLGFRVRGFLITKLLKRPPLSQLISKTNYMVQ